MLVSLPMYDWPEIREDTDRFWAALAKRLGVAGPLLRQADYVAPWLDPALLFSQTCGYPFTHALRGQVQLVATPHYIAEGCDGPNYRSFLFARVKQPLSAFRGATAVFNSLDSMSGMLALKLAFAPLADAGRFFGKAIESGGHVASLRAVQAGEADICAVDAVCVALAKTYRRDLLKGLVIVGQTPSVPGLPFITKAGNLQHLREALTEVFADDALAETRARLLLQGLSILQATDYDRITDLEKLAELHGGLIL